MKDIEQQMNQHLDPLRQCFLDEFVFDFIQFMDYTYGDKVRVQRFYNPKRKAHHVSVEHHWVDDRMLYPPVGTETYFFEDESLFEYRNKALKLYAACLPPYIALHQFHKRAFLARCVIAYEKLRNAFVKVRHGESTLNAWFALRDQTVESLKQGR